METSAASAVRGFGKRLTRSKTGSREPPTCTHEDGLVPRANGSMLWWTFVACGSWWERIIEKDAAGSGPPASKGTTEQLVGAPLTPSQSKKSNRSPTSCTHEERLAPRGNGSVLWWTRVFCGSRWERLEEVSGSIGSLAASPGSLHAESEAK